MKKYILSASAGALAMLILIIVAANVSTAKERVPEDYEHIDYISTITQEECYVCGDTKDFSGFFYWGEDNVGIVNLNTFELLRLEINRYDRDGNQIMEATGAMHMCGSTLGDILVTGMVDPDCSFASVNFDPEGETIDEGKIGQFLCQDCLYEFASSCYGGESIPPIAVVSFEHRYLAPLNERSAWFSRKDYLVTVNYDEDGSIGVVAVYSPPRFQEGKSTVD